MNNKIVFFEEDKIVINKTYDEKNLKESQKYILDNIHDGKLKDIDKEVLKEKTKQDALRDGLIEEKDLKKKILKKVVISILTSVIGFFILLMMTSGLSEESAIENIIFIIVMAIFFLLVYPISAITWIITSIIKYKQDPYFRTVKGKELNKKLEGLKKFLQDYTLLDKQNMEGITLWEDYLVYSVMFNQNKQIIEEFEKYIK